MIFSGSMSESRIQRGCACMELPYSILAIH